VNCALIYPDIVDTTTPCSIRPGKNGQVAVRRAEGSRVDAVQDALDLEKLRVVQTGGTADDSERTQDSGANLVCISPRAVVAYDSDTQYQHEAAQEGIEAVNTSRRGTRPRLLPAGLSRQP